MGRIRVALKGAGHNLIQGLDSYVVIAAAIGLGIAATIGIKLGGYLPGVTIALLALISLSLVRVHSRMGSIGRRSATASEILQPRESIDDILKLFDRSSEVWMWGAILTEHIPLLEGIFRRSSARSVKARILLIKHGFPSVGMLAFRAVPPPGPTVTAATAAEYVTSLRETAHYLNGRLEACLGILERIRESSSMASLEYRTIDYLSPYTIYVFDPNSPQAELVVWLGFHAGETHLRPTLRLRKDRDRDWFEYFSRQFEYGWRAAESVTSGGGWSSADIP